MANDGGASMILVQLAPLMVVMLLLVVPFVRILRRAGRSGWWVLRLFIWAIAFMRWGRPREDLQQVFG
jgi:uncharacterized membrane protein YhaH (DUF805 family)